MSQMGTYLPGGGGGSGVVNTLTGNTGGAVGPTANNINVVGDGTTITVAGNPGTSTLTISALSTGTVESVTGTSNQITASPTTGNVVLSIPATFIAPGSIAATTTLTASSGNITASSGTLVVSSPVTVANGGTGNASLTAYAVLCGGTTSTGAIQSIASVGTSGQVLTSNGAGALPTFQAAGGSGVTSITGTANQITASAATGAVTLSVPSTFTSPGSVTATTSVTATSGDITASAGRLVLTGDSSSTQASVYLNGQRFMHDGGANSNTFLGRATGNSSFNYSTTTNNTGIGNAALTNAVNTVTNATAVGFNAMTTSASTNDSNTAVGASCMSTGNISGNYNSGYGANCLQSLTSGTDNWAGGRYAMQASTTGARNSACGSQALLNLAGAGNNNVAIGYQAGSAYTTTESGNIIIGEANAGTIGESNKTRIGYVGGSASQTGCFIDGITGINIATAAVFVATTGQLGIIVSSERFKENINDLGEDSEAIYDLRPVSFTYKQDGSRGTGLIAEEVVEVLPDLVNLDEEGLPHNVRYHDLPVLLLNEIQKLNKRIQTLEQRGI